MLNANDCRVMAALLDEAARNLRAVMETDIAEREQFRHFLPDELEGSAIMLREQADALGVKDCHCKVCHSQKPEPHPPGPLYFPHIDSASGVGTSDGGQP